jgi:aromatic ring-opening dioxygenase catalytic subunit (LigB family)
VQVGGHGICLALATLPRRAWELLMTNESQSKTMPTLFIPHGGGPCFFMDWNPPDTWKKMESWLASLPGTIGEMPKAMVVISGHWESPELAVTGSAHPPLIYDYQGFPPHTYQLRYDAPGAPELAQQIVELFGGVGLPARVDPERGFDHGVFIPFKVMYPKADIPVVQLSLKAGLDPKVHIEIGRALQPLRKQGVLVVGSGMSYHNLRGFGDQFGPASDEFDEWLTGAVCAAEAAVRNQKLQQWQTAPHARLAHPREEHLLPLMVAAGAAGDDVGHRMFSDRVMGVTVSAYRFG